MLSRAGTEHAAPHLGSLLWLEQTAGGLSEDAAAAVPLASGSRIRGIPACSTKTYQRQTSGAGYSNVLKVDTVLLRD